MKTNEVRSIIECGSKLTREQVARIIESASSDAEHWADEAKDGTLPDISSMHLDWHIDSDLRGAGVSAEDMQRVSFAIARARANGSVDEPASSVIVLRVQPSRKAAYVKAAAPGTLSAWALRNLDAAASPSRLYRNCSPDWGDNVLACADDYRRQAEMFGLTVQIDERDDGIYIDGDLVGHAI